MSRYTEQELREIFFEALDLFNERLGSDITRDNTVLAFFAPDNGLTVYEQFCGRYFPKNLREDYKTEGYFESFAAQAFVGEDRYGVMIRSNIDFPLSELQFTFLHEISHLFCTRNEIEGGNYFDRYCMGSGVEDGMMNAGYAVWREAVADIMADAVVSDYTSMTLDSVKPEIGQLYRQLSPANPDSKKCMSLMIVYVMLTKEAGGAEDWSDVEPVLVKQLGLADQTLLLIFKMVFENLHQSPFWTVTPEFIMALGEAYLSLLTSKFFRENIQQ